MIVNWNPLVNSKFSIEGDFGLQDGYIEELEFESGKKRTWLKNSYIPRVFPALNLLLTHKRILNEKTEFEEFESWHEKDLRYGSFPFVVERIGFKKSFTTKTPEKGIYKFIDSPKYDRFGNTVLVTFGLEEEGRIPEVRHVFLATNKKEPLRTNSGAFIYI